MSYLTASGYDPNAQKDGKGTGYTFVIRVGTGKNAGGDRSNLYGYISLNDPVMRQMGRISDNAEILAGSPVEHFFSNPNFDGVVLRIEGGVQIPDVASIDLEYGEGQTSTLTWSVGEGQYIDTDLDFSAYIKSCCGACCGILVTGTTAPI